MRNAAWKKYCASASVVVACTLFLDMRPAIGELQYELRAGAAYSDNIRRASDLEEDETIAVAGLGLQWSGESRRFEGSLATDIEYRSYLNDTFEDDNFSSLDADFLFKFAPDVFEWTIQDKLGETRRDPFASETPDNREKINVFTTGPNLKIPFGKRTYALIEGRYRDTTFEESNNDNSSVGGRLAIARALTPHRTLSANVSSERIEYDDDVFTDFDRRAAYLRFDSEVSRGSVKAEIGVNELETDSNTDTFRGTYAGLAFSRQLSPLSNLAISYSQRYSDAGNFFDEFDNIGSRPGDSNDIIVTDDPFENERFAVSYSYNRRSTGFTLSLYTTAESYQERTEFDNDRLGADLKWSRAMSSNWNVTARVRVENREFDTLDEDEEYRYVAVGIERRVANAFWLALDYLNARRSGDAAFAEYTENRYTALIIFRPPGKGN